jgi:hypothetical protein
MHALDIIKRIHWFRLRISFVLFVSLWFNQKSKPPRGDEEHEDKRKDIHLRFQVRIRTSNPESQTQALHSEKAVRNQDDCTMRIFSTH